MSCGFFYENVILYLIDGKRDDQKKIKLAESSVEKKNK
jgi:hypothetical protein